MGKKTKTMIAVEYYSEYYGRNDDNNVTTFEIFDSVKNAYIFYIDTIRKEDNNVVEIFVADFLEDYIYIEDGVYNYENVAGLYGYRTTLKFN